MNKKNDKQATIQDIAKKLNISASTVSRALKDNPRISEETKKKVWKVAKLLSYKTHLKEPLSYTENSKNIAVIIPHLKSNLYKGFIKGLQKALSKKAYYLIILLSENSEEKETKLFELLSGLNVEGLVFSLSPYYCNADNLQSFIDRKIPVLCYNSLNLDLNVPKIVLDHYQSGFKAVNHLVSVGCDKIAQLMGNKKNMIYNEIVNGHKAALEKNKIEFDERYIIYSELTDEDIESSLKMLLSLNEPPDGIAVKNNITAVKVLRILEKNALNVPEDIAVLSYESDEFSKFLNPSVTTLSFSPQKLGRKAGEIILSEIDNKRKDKQISDSIFIEPNKLVIRSSTMKN